MMTSSTSNVNVVINIDVDDHVERIRESGCSLYTNFLKVTVKLMTHAWSRGTFLLQWNFFLACHRVVHQSSLVSGIFFKISVTSTVSVT